MIGWIRTRAQPGLGHRKDTVHMAFEAVSQLALYPSLDNSTELPPSPPQ